MIAFYHTIRFWIVMVFLSFVLGVCATLARAFDSTGNLSHRISSLWGRWLCTWNGIEVTVEGLEYADPDRAQIFVANHQGYFDIFTLSGYLPVQLRWMSKASLFKIPFVGWSMWASGYIPVERSNKKKAYQAFLAAIEKLKSGCSIVIFPEGTRSEDGTIGKFKKGGQLLAVRSQAPMVPVTVIGTRTLIQKGSGIMHPGLVRIILSPPIEVGHLEEQKEEDVLEQIRETICRNFEAGQIKQ